MKCCVVVDTNVIVSALLSKKDDAATVQVLRAMLGGGFTPLYHEDILDEYEEVLHRPSTPSRQKLEFTFLPNTVIFYEKKYLEDAGLWYVMR